MARVRLRLREGYSRLLESLEVELSLGRAPARLRLRSPLRGLMGSSSRPVELLFRAARTYRGSWRGLEWTLHPGRQLRSLLLPPGSNFFGNFRVPEDHWGIQWEVESRLEGSVAPLRPVNLVEVRGRSRLLHSWVRLLSQNTSLEEALRLSWAAYRNPLRPEEAFELPEGAVVRWRWSGALAGRLPFQGALIRAWRLPPSGPGLLLEAGAAFSAAFGAQLSWRREGSFQLQLRRKGNRLILNLLEVRSRLAERGAGISLGVPVDLSVRRLRLAQPAWLRDLAGGLVQPARNSLNSALRQALQERLEIAWTWLAVRDRRRRHLLRAEWAPSLPAGTFRRTYREILAGAWPEAEQGFRMRGRMDEIQERYWEVKLNIFNWIVMEKGEREVRRRSLIRQENGELILEITRSLEKRRRSWEELQLLRLLEQRGGGGEGAEGEASWSYALSRRFEREQLRRLLRMALHGGMLGEFELPPPSAFPLFLRVLLVTRLAPSALQAARTAPPERQWKALLQALELVHPERYARSTFWRDWVVSAQLRRLVERNPVQAHLLSLYPIPGRSRFERLQVVAEYRRVRRFLDLLQAWREGEEVDWFSAFRVGLDLPVFVFFHLLTKGKERRSAVLVRGELTRLWGSAEVLEEEFLPAGEGGSL